MELDTLRRRAEDDKNQFRLKNNQLKTEIEDLLKENRKVATEKMTLSNRLESLRKLNKQMEKKVETMEQKPGAQKFAKQLELQEKLSFTVQKFEEQKTSFFNSTAKTKAVPLKMLRRSCLLLQIKITKTVPQC